MSAAYERHPHRPLVDPVLVMALDGWIDAGSAAAGAGAAILTGLEVEPIATFDVDELLDHRARRPVVTLVAGVNEGLSWPSIELGAAHDLNGRDLLVLAGPEPDHSWRAFAHAVLALAEELGVTMMLGLGAYPAAVPHTRPTQLSITANSEELAGRWSYLRGTLEVPAGTQAVIERFAEDRGIDAVTLWAQVPHYASAGPYPAASLALLAGAEAVTGLALPRSDLPAEADDVRGRLEAAVAGNQEHTAMVRGLEVEADEAEGTAELPSGDELAAELERFLRDEGDGR